MACFARSFNVAVWSSSIQANIYRNERDDVTHRRVMVSWQNHIEEAVLRQQWGWQISYMRLPKINFDTLLPLLPVTVPGRLQPAGNSFRGLSIKM